MFSRGRDEREFSAGGVVVRGDEVAVIVPTRRAADGRKVLALPKGHADGDETPQQAAEREVREETGLVVELIEPLGEVRYFYQRDGRRIAKRVAYFLFEHRGGSLAEHDSEVEQARFMALSDAESQLTYSGEREMVGLAITRRRTAR